MQQNSKGNNASHNPKASETENHSESIRVATNWFQRNDWQPFPFQLECWHAYLEGYCGLVNAPTGFGKTYALFVPIAMEFLQLQNKSIQRENTGIHAIWISPIKALTKEIHQACKRAAEGLKVDIQVEVRSGDTTTSERRRQWDQPPGILITTPESVHIMMANKGYARLFKNLKAVVVDEWHELLGSKRGVQVQLALSRLKAISGGLKIWGVSATISNLEEAAEVLLGGDYYSGKWKLIKSNQTKKIAVESIFPEKIEDFPWSGFLGIRMLDQIIPLIYNSKTTLIFTNTRSQCEIWYQKILDSAPDLAGLIAMHHGSINRELRDWVETALHEERLKAVVCTSSLDLGVDFRPVETIIQVGSPKGVSRFIQRAGRSGHQPGAVSKIFFVPTHALELAEGAALRTAIAEGVQEPRMPYVRSFDVLIQYLMTLAVSDGFKPAEIYPEIKQTHCFQSLTDSEWSWILSFLQHGGSSLQAYDEYQKIKVKDSRYYVADQFIAKRHKLSIGTIVSDVSLQVRFLSGRRLGTIEEWFVSKLNPGDVFWFAGRPLELVRIKGMVVQVKQSRKKSGKIPSWQGGRMPLSTMLAKTLRKKFIDFREGLINDMELELLKPLLNLQMRESYLPLEHEFLVEYFETTEGFHLCMYPFEGRFVHEGIAALVAKRLSKIQPISFSIAMNDYGFELLSDRQIPVEKLINTSLFKTENLILDIQASMNSVEMARRKFRDIARISGLVFQGFPGKLKKERHLQASSGLLFEVFKDYDPDNLMYQQTFEEVLTFQLEESRLRDALLRIGDQKIVISRPDNYTPFSFPIIVDRLSREKLSSESMEDKVKRLIQNTLK